MPFSFKCCKLSLLSIYNYQYMLLSWIEALQLKPSSMINKSRTLWQKQQQHKERLWNWTQIKLCNKGAEQCNRQKEMHLDLLRRCREWDTGFFYSVSYKAVFLFSFVCHRAVFVLLYVTKPDCCMLYAAVCYKTRFLYAVCCSMLQNLIVFCCMLQSPFLSVLFVVLQSQTTALWWSRHTCRCRACSLHPSCDGTARM